MYHYHHDGTPNPLDCPGCAAERAALTFYEDSYSNNLSSHRLYPNEELCRFMERHYFPLKDRRNTKVLELGCGTAANLWMVAHEGFSAYGVDLSSTALSIAKRKCDAVLIQSDMTKLPFADGFFDLVFDVFSTFCLDESGFLKCVNEASRVLKPGGRFFIYTPGKRSDAWTDYAPAVRIDGSTLNRMLRPTAPFDVSHPFRFVSQDELKTILGNAGLSVSNVESAVRTYNSGHERFEFIVADAVKL